jgi:hypothetical protein
VSNHQGSRSSRLDFVQRRHPGFHGVVDVAVEHPSARILGNHIDGAHLRLHEFDDIRALSILENHVAVPVRK